MEWTGARYADTPTVEASTWIDAEPRRVWSLVSDIELMPTLSNELQSVEWVEGATGPKVGARFVGHNSHDAFGEWSTTSQILACDEAREFSWVVGDPENPSATWRFVLTPRDGGTFLTYWMQMGPGRSGLSVAIDAMPDKEEKIVFVRLREFETAIGMTLASIKRLAEHGVR
ncbi:cyclase [Mycobacterium intermedium]|uniref:Cyclase n=1 Tax=Mycobacterium intermedium TaxID=28445 RepID=A0A1E3SKG2_MYCIE|nr:SRPBCC family protein [Mycobacterium intermedium]MCV6962882.1 SRPBCC family protein [Mycobacterium intermedium]ODR02602.1 cyclase [Mycobacterium intermedium]OPE50394.1 cyclase [Mycobacterium intermedium]ORB10274.1 cyclase [Mycobacterium intermedium]